MCLCMSDVVDCVNVSDIKTLAKSVQRLMLEMFVTVRSFVSVVNVYGMKTLAKNVQRLMLEMFVTVRSFVDVFVFVFFFLSQLYVFFNDWLLCKDCDGSCVDDKIDLWWVHLTWWNSSKTTFFLDQREVDDVLMIVLEL